MRQHRAVATLVRNNFKDFDHEDKVSLLKQELVEGIMQISHLSDEGA